MQSDFERRKRYWPFKNVLRSYLVGITEQLIRSLTHNLLSNIFYTKNYKINSKWLDRLARLFDHPRLFFHQLHVAFPHLIYIIRSCIYVRKLWPLSRERLCVAPLPHLIAHEFSQALYWIRMCTCVCVCVCAHTMRVCSPYTLLADLHMYAYEYRPRTHLIHNLRWRLNAWWHRPRLQSILRQQHASSVCFVSYSWEETFRDFLTSCSRSVRQVLSRIRICHACRTATTGDRKETSAMCCAHCDGILANSCHWFPAYIPADEDTLIKARLYTHALWLRLQYIYCMALWMRDWLPSLLLFMIYNERALCTLSSWDFHFRWSLNTLQ